MVDGGAPGEEQEQGQVAHGQVTLALTVAPVR